MPLATPIRNLTTLVKAAEESAMHRLKGRKSADVNHRSAALAAMRGEPVDHILFIAPGMGSLALLSPQPWHTAGAVSGGQTGDIQRDLGVGIFGFGAWIYLILQACAQGDRG